MAEALKVIDEVSSYALKHRFYIEYDGDVLKRLQDLKPRKPSPPIHHLLETSADKDKAILSHYCHKIEKSKGTFKSVLRGLEAHYKQINTRDSHSKGKIIDSIIRSGNPENLKAVGKVLWVIGSLALLYIRDEDARTIATWREHISVASEDTAAAADGMWKALRKYNGEATRKSLTERMNAAVRWDKFLEGKEVGTVVVLHILSPTLQVFYLDAPSLLTLFSQEVTIS